ncbi:hypothetical protein GCM10029992_25370 [Glycomyces albus]
MGVVHLFAHNDASTVPPAIASAGQGSGLITGEYDPGDRFGYSLDMVDYIPTNGSVPYMMLAIGVPGEAVGSEDSSGLAMVMWSPGEGITEYKNLSQDLDKNPDDGAEPGDGFGAGVVMVNRTPGQNTSTDTLLLAVGSPGEDAEGVHDVGEIGLYSMVESVGDGATRCERSLRAPDSTWPMVPRSVRSCTPRPRTCSSR